MSFIQAIGKSMREFIIEFFKLVVFLLLSLFVAYFLLISILTALLPDFKLGGFDLSISHSDSFRIFVIFFLSFITVAFIDIKRHRIRQSTQFSFSKFSKIEILIYFLCIFLLSYFLSSNIISEFKVEQKFLLPISILLLIPTHILVRRIIDSYNNLNLSYFKIFFLTAKENISLVKVQYKPLKIRSLLSRENYLKTLYTAIYAIAVLSLSLLLAALIIGLLASSVNRYLAYKKQLRESFVITSVKPKNVIASEKVILEGYNLGWRLSKKDRLMSNSGEIIEVDLWTDTKIIFKVPLNWKEGRVTIWVEKEKRQDTGKIDFLRSKPISLTVLSRWEFYPTEGEFRSKFSTIRVVKKLKQKILLEGGLLYRFR